MWTTQSILEKLQRESQSLREVSVQRIGLFGSFSRGEATSSSDLDFLVELGDVNFDNYISLKIMLEDWFERPIDLVLAEDLRDELRSNILSEVVYAHAIG